MSSHSILKELVPLQDAFNKKVDPRWLKANFPFHRAIWMEAAELVEGTNSWKWWKAQSRCDKTQLQIEVIDILHFLISWAMINEDAESKRPDAGTLGKLALALDGLDHTPLLDEFNVESIIEKAEILAGLAASKNLDGAIFAFIQLAHYCQLDTSSLRRLYISKNALNIFRNINGYKEGTYVKIWEGQEDNIVLERIVYEQPGIGFEQLIAALGDYYRRYVLQAV